MIDWLIQRAADDPQVAAGFAPEGLLSAPETAVYDSLHIAKRRKDWILGRWTAKKLVQAAAEKSGKPRLSCRDISILAADDGAPEVWLLKEERLSREDYNISISHSRAVSLCAIIMSATHLLGADIEAVEPRSDRFLEDYFSEDERELVRRASSESRDRLITAIWSAKESALKAVRQGLRLDTRSLNCGFPVPFGKSLTWTPFTIQWRGPSEDGGYPHLCGWWRVWGDFVLTLVIADEATNMQRRTGGRKQL